MKYIVISLILSFLSIAPLSAASYSNEASMRIVVDKASFLDQEYLDISIMMDAPIASYNAAMAMLTFDTDKLELLETNLGQPFCILSVPELPSTPENTEIVICGNPEANQTTSTKLAQLRFHKLSSGPAQFSLSGSQMLSADGYARNILGDAEEHVIIIEK